MTRNSKIGIAAIVVIAIIAVGVGAYELSYMPPSSTGNPTVSIVSPTDGATVSDTFTVTVSTSNFNIPTQGHIHVYLDTLQNYQLGNGPTFTFTNVAPGTHVIWAQLQNPDHSPLNPPVQTQPITITVESSGSSSPTVSIASPVNGATVTGSTVTVTVASSNFNIPGQGDYWVYLDNTFQAGNGPTFTFTNVAPGTHTIYAQLYNSDGTPVSPAVVSATMTITVTASGGGSSPTVSILSPNNGDMVAGSAVTVAVTSTNMPAGGYYYVSMSNGGFITGNGPTFTFPSVTSGTHTITVDIRNPDGSMLNPDVSQTITITVTGGTGGGYSSSSGGGYGY